MFFIVLVSIVFSLNGVNIFCTLQKYWCNLYYNMKSYNHRFIKICSSMKVSFFVYINYLSILFHLQMMSILYFTYSTVCSPNGQCLSLCQLFSIPMLSIYTMALILIIIIFIIIRLYLITNVLMIPALSPFQIRVHKCACVINYTWLD